MKFEEIYEQVKNPLTKELSFEDLISFFEIDLKDSTLKRTPDEKCYADATDIFYSLLTDANLVSGKDEDYTKVKIPNNSKTWINLSKVIYEYGMKKCPKIRPDMK